MLNLFPSCGRGTPLPIKIMELQYSVSSDTDGRRAGAMVLENLRGGGSISLWRRFFSLSVHSGGLRTGFIDHDDPAQCAASAAAR